MSIFKQELNKLEKEREELLKILSDAKIRKQEAAAEGDLRENEGYKTASADEDRALKDISRKDEQIYKLTTFISSIPRYSGFVSLGSKVSFVYKEINERRTKFVTPASIDSLDEFLPEDTPVGKAIMGKKKGDIVSVIVLGITFNIEIVEVE